MATYGKIGKFIESEESWTQYVERLKQNFLANEVEDAAKLNDEQFYSVFAGVKRDLLKTGEASGDNFQEDNRHPREAPFTEAK